jgi:hypothetical protein
VAHLARNRDGTAWTGVDGGSHRARIVPQGRSSAVRCHPTGRFVLREIGLPARANERMRMKVQKTPHARRGVRLAAVVAMFVLWAAAVPASAFEDRLELLVRVDNARLAAVTTHRGLAGFATDTSRRLQEYTRRDLWSIAPVWNGTEHWHVALDSRIFVDPTRAARAAMGFVDIGAIYSPLKNLDFAIGFVRNPKDGALTAMVFTIGLSARY